MVLFTPFFNKSLEKGKGIFEIKVKVMKYHSYIEWKKRDLCTYWTKGFETVGYVEMKIKQQQQTKQNGTVGLVSGPFMLKNVWVVKTMKL